MSLSEDRAASAQQVSIREFKPGDEVCFRKLNEEWITRYFGIEAKDEKTLADPQSSILAHGGRNHFRDDRGRVRRLLCPPSFTGRRVRSRKNGSRSGMQGRGVGRKLLQAVVETARSAGARRLYLETNHILTPAIRLYESIGFKPLPPSRIVSSPYARADVYMEMILV